MNCPFRVLAGRAHLSLAALAAGSSLLAQSAPPSSSADDAVVELSPFVLSADEDVGYVATTTLAGSRIRTPVEDVGAAISIVTEEFLRDTGATDLRDLLVYTTGTEASGFGGNFAASGVSTEQATDGSVANNSVGTRVRGLASATQTRGYFRTPIPFNAYNAGRVEINRGANAILFGVGSPAGIINYTPHTADAERAFGEVELQFGRFESTRASLNLNQPLVPRQAAIRVAAVRDDENFQQRPAFSRDSRLYGTVTLSPDSLKTASGILSGTTLRVSGETGDIESNNPRNLTPQDRIALWFEPTERMREFGITPKATHNVSLPFVAANGLTVAQDLNRSAIVIFPEHTSSVPSAPAGPGHPDIIGRQWVINNTVAGTSAYLAPGRQPDSLRRAGDPDAAFFIADTLTDPTLFDFRNRLLDGDNKRTHTEFEAINLSLEQLLLNDRAGFEFSYDNQERTDDYVSLLDPTRAILTIDPNTHLLDGSPNPHFGRPYTNFRPEAGYNRAEMETTRFTAFGEMDFGRELDSPLGRWLGRHIGTVLLQEEEAFDENREGMPFYLPGAFPYGNGQQRNLATGKSVEVVSYLGPSLANATTASGADIPGIEADRLNLPAHTSGGLFALRRQAANSEFEYVPLDVARARSDLVDNAFGASKSRRVIESEAINLQSYFLDGHLVGSTGWRREEVESWSVVAPPTAGGENTRDLSSSAYAFGAEPDQQVKDTLHSWSVVAKTPRRWLRPLRVVTGFNLHYNESENFAPPSGTRMSPSGGLLAPPAGSTRDFGFTLNLGDNRLILRANWYETVQSNVTEPTISGAIDQVVNIHVMAYNAARDGIAEAGPDGFPVHYVPPPQELLDLFNVRIDNGAISYANPGVVATTDYVAEGVELEAVLNPTENWTIAFNAARQESVRSNSGADAQQLLYDTPVAGGQGLVPTWHETGAQVPLFIVGTTQAEWAQRFVVNPYNRIRLQDNGPAQELREWRFNVVTNYRFDEGLLRGFSVGGAGRWQDKVAIGFPLIDSPDGERIIDVTRPFYGPTEFTTDAWVGYEREVWNGRVTWRLQLNVRNVLGEDELIPVQAQPTGEAAVFRIPESRTWTLSSRFSF